MPWKDSTLLKAPVFNVWVQNIQQWQRILHACYKHFPHKIISQMFKWFCTNFLLQENYLRYSWDKFLCNQAFSKKLSREAIKLMYPLKGRVMLPIRMNFWKIPNCMTPLPPSNCNFDRAQVNLGSDLWVRMSVTEYVRDLCWDLTDATLADKDTSSIPNIGQSQAIWQ